MLYNNFLYLRYTNGIEHKLTFMILFYVYVIRKIIEYFVKKKKKYNNGKIIGRAHNRIAVISRKLSKLLGSRVTFETW